MIWQHVLVDGDCAYVDGVKVSMFVARILFATARYRAPSSFGGEWVA